MHEAAFGGRLAVVERLVEAGARTDLVECQFGATAAGCAAHGGHEEVVRFLEAWLAAIGALRLSHPAIDTYGESAVGGVREQVGIST